MGRAELMRFRDKKNLGKFWTAYRYLPYTRVRKWALEQRARGMKPRACHRPLRETLGSYSCNISSVHEKQTKITLD